MKGKMEYKLLKLEEPIYRSGRRKFTYKIVRLKDEFTWETLFLFQDKKTAQDTLEKLGSK
jgi:hypothetical protein